MVNKRAVKPTQEIFVIQQLGPIYVIHHVE